MKKAAYYGWYSPKQHGAAGGYAEYLSEEGEVVQVSEVTDEKKEPSSNWDDFEYRGPLKEFVRVRRSGE